MGHYCYTCDEKIVGGVKPTCCRCVECYCEKCWDDLFGEEIITEPFEHKLYYKDQEGELVEVKEILYRRIVIELDPCCPRCLLKYVHEDSRPY